ncbi:ADP-ribosylation factor-like protein 2-binding protein [Condylostylus longicornis]|uniref:ADP-ribosylation factor-like protein 2-binding protein n=1 Tax=Condylostylus longicornis TaxID=2530218 RepID=UPI00244E5530|nr:ADP-ribosylation factor-like protein 2-binding protein [Condylostylus longicornis]
MSSLGSNLEDNEFSFFLTSPCSDKFDVIIGEIENIVVEEEFQNLQNSFLEHNYRIFEDTEENKLEYYEIFKTYANTIEAFIVEELQKRIPDFDIEEFAEELENKKHLLDGEIFELLLSFSDFVKFKDLILDYKAQKDGRFNSLDLFFSVTKINIAD